MQIDRQSHNLPDQRPVQAAVNRLSGEHYAQ
jgi:hypothetical protein